MNTNEIYHNVNPIENSILESGKVLIRENRMNKSLIRIFKRLLTWIIILFAFVNNTYSQKYDLIVTAKNDSIACYIDSISDSNIFFEMRYNRNWIHTYYNKSQVKDYKLKKINKKDVSFKQGSSYIINPDSLLINQVNRNIIYGTAGFLMMHYTINLNYERILYISEKTKNIWSFRLGYGLINGDGKIVLGTFNNLIGKGNNKFEMNIGATYINEPHAF